jgi:hypothetical protein
MAAAFGWRDFFHPLAWSSIHRTGLQHPRGWGFPMELAETPISLGPAHPLQPVELLSTSPSAVLQVEWVGLKAA